MPVLPGPRFLAAALVAEFFVGLEVMCSRISLSAVPSTLSALCRRMNLQQFWHLTALVCSSTSCMWRKLSASA